MEITKVTRWRWTLVRDGRLPGHRLCAKRTQGHDRRGRWESLVAQNETNPMPEPGTSAGGARRPVRNEPKGRPGNLVRGAARPKPNEPNARTFAVSANASSSLARGSV